MVISLATMPLSALSIWVADHISELTPLKYDQFVFRFDALLGQPSFVLGSLVFRSQTLQTIATISYGMMPAMVALTLIAYVWLRTKEEMSVLAKAVLFNFVFALPLYLLFPVCGPRYAFPGFPFEQPPHLIPQPIALQYAPNGIPSIHTSTAVLVLWFLRGWWWGRLIGWGFLALTVFATLGSGEHYAFDLLCAIPYTVSILALARPTKALISTEERVSTTT